jgi:hypothetical protein
LTGPELVQLIDRVFAPTAEERRLAILVDLPDGDRPDHSRWSSRRALAQSWVDELRRHAADRYRVELYAYPNVGANNAELPDRLWPIVNGLPEHAAALADLASVARDEVLAARPMVLAPTELSATAPLKLLGRRLGFRAATMGGFRTGMLPAMRLDLEEVDRRVRLLAQLLDAAESAVLELDADGERHTLFLDLRHRTAHASSGLLRQPGAVGNLPSGEAYIVPYEGESSGDPSRTRGVLPIQFGPDIALLAIEHNRVVDIAGGGAGGAEWADRIRREPATANLAELGLGVLAELGIEPIGSTLLDEKLGLHIALGRSDHFGGAVGPGDFSAPEHVVHQDFVYLPATQPRVGVRRLDLETPTGPVAVIRDDRYVIDFAAAS